MTDAMTGDALFDEFLVAWDRALGPPSALIVEVEVDGEEYWIEFGTDPDFAGYEKVLRADPCVYCGATSYALDHIVARDTGGPDGWDNRVGICGSCNSSKRDRSVLTFLGTRRWRPDWDAMDMQRRAWRAFGRR
jgi:hypothetical protein